MVRRFTRCEFDEGEVVEIDRNSADGYDFLKSSPYGFGSR
jgi:hypothetical protein